MSVIIRLQNLPWSANALDIRNFFRGLSIPEGGVHIVGGELGDAFIAFSTDEDARQAMMLDGGKIKEIQVRLLLSSRSEMHKVIEAARQSVPLLTLQPTLPVVTAPPPAPVAPVVMPAPALGAFAPALGATAVPSLPGLAIPGLGNPLEIPQPAVIEPPTVSLDAAAPIVTGDVPHEEERPKKEKERRRSRSRSRDRDKKDRSREKKDRRDRSRSRDRSRDRRRRDRSRSRDRRDRKRDRRDRSRSRERSPRRSRDRRTDDRRTSPQLNSQENSNDAAVNDKQFANQIYGNGTPSALPAQPSLAPFPAPRFGTGDPSMADTFNRLQELGKKRNPNAFQGELQNGGMGRARGGAGRGGSGYRRDGRPSRFETDPPRDCCVVVRNAPNHTSYGDVRRFFPHAIDNQGIKMINDATGRRTGTIYVRFIEPRSRHLALQRERNELKGELVTVEPLEDAEYEKAVDSYLPCRDDRDHRDVPVLESDDPSRPTPPPAAPRPPFTVLQLSDLPLFVKEHDIIKTFNEFSLLSIQLTECRATRTKTALVQFVKPEDALTALERKEPYMFGWRAAHVAPAPAPLDVASPIVNDDAERHHDAPPVERNEPVAPRDPRQRRPPRHDSEALRPSFSPGQQNAHAAPSPFYAGSFPPQQFNAPFGGTLFSSFPQAMSADPRAGWPRPAFPGATGGAPTPAVHIDLEDEPLDCVLMKGLPREATDRTIVEFFAETGAVPARIHLMLDTQDQPSGDCFCEFRSPQEARRAASKHGQELDGCRVTVDLVARSVVEDALEGPKQMESETVRQSGLLGESPAPLAPYYEPMHGGFGPRGAPFRGRGGFEPPHGRPFRRGGFNERRRGYEPRIRGRGFPMRGRGRGGPSSNAVDEDPDPALEEFGAPGCVVCMENVPFRASVDDILEYFSEFELTQDDIIRRFNERGHPTGDARVAFRTPFDAQRAVSTKHMQRLLDRHVSLRLL